MCVLDLMTCSSSEARLPFTYESVLKGLEFSLLSALSFSMFILFFPFSLSPPSKFQEVPEELPSPRPVFRLCWPGTPSANHWSLLCGLVGESPEPGDVCASQLWSALGFWALYRDMCFCKVMLAVWAYITWTRRWIPHMLSCLKVLPLGLILLPFFSLAPCPTSLFFFLPNCVPGLISR